MEERKVTIRIDLTGDLATNFLALKRRKGIKNNSEMVRILIREEYLKEHQLVPRFMHVNTYDDHATIRDNKIGRELNIYFRNGGVAYCEYCEKTSCEHIDYTFTLPEVTEPLARRGWKNKF